MTAETPAPRWLAAVWLWLPAAAALVLFGGVAVLQARGVSAWWAFAALACSAAYAGRERWPVPALAATLVVVATTRLPGVPVLNEQFDVAYLLLLFVPVLPLVAVASRLEVRRVLARAGGDDRRHGRRVARRCRGRRSTPTPRRR